MRIKLLITDNAEVAFILNKLGNLYYNTELYKFTILLY